MQLCFVLQSMAPKVINFCFLINCRSHLGATISGLFFGYLTCPSIELDNAAKNGRKEAVALVRRQASPCKSAAVFVLSILAFAVIAFVCGTQFTNMDLE